MSLSQERVMRVVQAAPRSGARPSTGGPAQKGNLEAQIARGLAAAMRQKGGRVTMRLEPASMGKLTIRLEMSGERVSARFETTTEQARRLLESARGELRTALEARGLVVDRVQVHLASTEESGAPGREPAGLARGGEAMVRPDGDAGAGGGGSGGGGGGSTGEGGREAEPHAGSGPEAESGMASGGGMHAPGGEDPAGRSMVRLSLDVVG